MFFRVHWNLFEPKIWVAIDWVGPPSVDSWQEREINMLWSWWWLAIWISRSKLDLRVWYFKGIQWVNDGKYMPWTCLDCMLKPGICWAIPSQKKSIAHSRVMLDYSSKQLLLFGLLFEGSANTNTSILRPIFRWWPWWQFLLVTIPNVRLLCWAFHKWRYPKMDDLQWRILNIFHYKPYHAIKMDDLGVTPF